VHRTDLGSVRELITGSSRSNDLRGGVAKMPTSLLSGRLKNIEGAGIVERNPAPLEKMGLNAA